MKFGGIFTDHRIANLLLNVPMKAFCNFANI